MSFGFESRHKGTKAKRPVPPKPAGTVRNLSQTRPEAASLSLEQLPADALLRESQLVISPKRPGVVSILPYSAPTMWRRIAAGLWPKPIKLSARMSAWRAGECRDVRAAQIAGKSEAQIRELVQRIHAARKDALSA